MSAALDMEGVTDGIIRRANALKTAGGIGLCASYRLPFDNRLIVNDSCPAGGHPRGHPRPRPVPPAAGGPEAHVHRMPIADSSSTRSPLSVAARLRWFPIYAPSRSSRSSCSSPLPPSASRLTTMRSRCYLGTRRCPSRS